MIDNKINFKKDRQDLNTTLMGQSQQVEIEKKREAVQSLQEKMFHENKIRPLYIFKNVSSLFFTSSIILYGVSIYIAPTNFTSGSFDLGYITGYNWAMHGTDWHLFNTIGLALPQALNIYADIQDGADFLFVNLKYLLGTTAFLWIPTVLANKRRKNLINIKNKEELRYRTGLDSYEIINDDKENRKIYFRLLDGERENEAQLLEAKEIIQNQRGFQSSELVFQQVEQDENDLDNPPSFFKKLFRPNLDRLGYFSFNEKLPTINQLNKSPYAQPDVLPDRLFLGRKNASGECQYTVPWEGKGKIQPHMLVVGGSGAGKSFFLINTLLHNWFVNKEEYNNISKLQIIDFKGTKDFEEISKYDKVSFCGGDVEEVIDIFMDLEIEILAREAYRGDLGLSTEQMPKYVVLIDEVQKIIMGTKATGSPILVNTWKDINVKLSNLCAQSRSANMTIIVALQEMTTASLDSGILNNLAHRIALKNKNMNMLIDNDTIDAMGIDSNKMKKGQFFYTDEQNGGGIYSPAISSPLKAMSVDDLKITQENIDFEKGLAKYKAKAVEKIRARQERIKRLEEEGATNLSSGYKDYGSLAETEEMEAPIPVQVEPEQELNTLVIDEPQITNGSSSNDTKTDAPKDLYFELNSSEKLLNNALKDIKSIYIYKPNRYLINKESGKAVLWNSTDGIVDVGGDFIVIGEISRDVFADLGVQL